MGEYAELAWQYAMRKGSPAKSNYKGGRNPITVCCLICGKGIRPVGGRIKDSVDAHYKVKHRPTQNAKD